MAKPGDLVYYRGDWFSEELPDVKEVDDWEPSIVIGIQDKLSVISFKEVPDENGCICHQTYDRDCHFPTLEQALTRAAEEEEEFARRTLLLAARLREMAARAKKNLERRNSSV